MFVDQPIIDSSEDSFQRYQFAERVAAIACNDSEDRSLVVGLYGRWGEGKTSTLNFVQAQLPKDVIVINFNPWYFSDEHQLLKAFFTSLSVALDKEINTGKEKIGRVLADYGESIGEFTEYIPKIGRAIKSLKSFGKKLSEVTLESQKKRVDKIIQKSSKRIVVFMDDIDRLDVSEIQAVFKLVKLVGDFPKTTYVLSFDDEMVAEALSPMYGNGSLNSGHSFMEKIIQVPIKIPKITSDVLLQYTLKHIEKVLGNHSLTLNDQVLHPFIESFTKYLLPMLTTPRSAIRYTNSMRLSIEILLEEVNINDLLFIEGIKVLEPKVYEFIRFYGPDILNVGSKTYYDSNHKKRDDVLGIVDNFISAYNDEKGKAIKNLILHIFPQLWDTHGGGILSDKTVMKLISDKRICTKRYFERYFTYSLGADEISEKHFNSFLTELNETDSDDKILSSLQTIVEQYKAFNIVARLRAMEGKFSYQQSKNLLKSLSCLGHEFPLDQSIRIATTYSLSASLIVQLFKSIKLEERFNTIVKVLSAPTNFNYAMEIHYWLLYKGRKDNLEALTHQEEKDLEEILLERFIVELKAKDLFAITSDINLSRVLHWWIDSNTKGSQLSSLLYDKLEGKDANEFALRLLKVFTPTINSTTLSPKGVEAKREEYKAGFFENNYKELKKVIAPKLLNENLFAIYGMNPYQGDLSKISDRDKIDDETLVSVFQRYLKDDLEK
ncbi:P-loop NTPase fold protein [Sphingobacterium sp. UT-1RO-CII-1]|uniref:KAP family P-loop NTPase fold protein n=1 Tax=Sphingobacterium sp. UT-1RO-CII-1 TaxID=2995225 RepID=UPI00227B75F7|nr:P-loop NTPase fold protein [Sphingobacterium sp. UT-1RO-CII-1]MCY4779272.1 P-loop NTPase fold protein [Sphingobacterium sp. UT-1RO-CII-1]